ncbi:MAG TPA: radical SAM family heme chaperone HemW [Methylibium sp.]|uniref:radical SAM family heme chaperone HemW n=1 Tax=Methylibium sp. TaxID=2067992 RepID=UPI002DBE2FBB|nr:radical SAM family heme chaperone HemW [Methylibium sp.]HEU4458541.1 radical SAM family heme chaperone HemW [Methylibium sp.]
MNASRIDITGLHRKPGAIELQALPPLALYVHIPWCLKKCPYCDFNSHEMPAATRARVRGPREGALRTASPVPEPARELPEAAYLDALRADLEAALPLVWGRRVTSVFLGGGTPSLFAPEAIGRLLDDVRARLPLEPGCEITLEANPGTFERERFRAFREAGVTRLSIGVQSFDDAKLAALGRVHDAAQARAAVEEASRCFDTFNLDLMYALPGQGREQHAADLRQALAFEPPHLSVYHLSLEPNTRFAAEPPPGLPDDDAAFAMLDDTIATVAAHGLARYEVSAYAKPGHRAQHNLNYWRFGDYLGLGAGAHGKLSFAHRILRQTRWREPAAYMRHALDGQAVSNEQEIGADELPFEFMLNALRLAEGVPLALFRERTGLGIEAIAEPLAEARSRGLLEDDGLLLKPTPRGFDFLNDLQALFLPRAASVRRG